MDGLGFAESARWRDGRFWVSDWAAGRVHSVGPDGAPRLEAEVASFPLCFDFLPDGRLLLLSSADDGVLRREADGSLTAYADLSSLSTKPWNEIVVDHRGHAWANNIGFDFPEGEFAPGFVVHVSPDGTARQVADGLAFPNGMAITPDGATLIVAESYAEQLTAYSVDESGGLGDRRVWAATPGDHPDGICLDAEGAVWYADVASKHCVRVREGGEVLARVEFDRGAFSCALGDEADQRLYVVGQDWGGDQSGPSGRVGAFPAPQPSLLLPG